MIKVQGWLLGKKASALRSIATEYNTRVDSAWKFFPIDRNLAYRHT